MKEFFADGIIQCLLYVDFLWPHMHIIVCNIFLCAYICAFVRKWSYTWEWKPHKAGKNASIPGSIVWLSVLIVDVGGSSGRTWISSLGTLRELSRCTLTWSTNARGWLWSHCGSWLVILLQFPSGPVVLHGTVSIPERLVSHWLARKSYLMTWSVFRCHYWYWLPRQIDLWDKPKPISWLISRNKIQYISEGILWRRILK